MEGVSTIEPLVEYLRGIGYDCRIEGQEGLAFLLILAWPNDSVGETRPAAAGTTLR